MFNNIGSHDGLKRKKIRQNATNPVVLASTSTYIYIYLKIYLGKFKKNASD